VTSKGVFFFISIHIVFFFFSPHDGSSLFFFLKGFSPPPSPAGGDKHYPPSCGCTSVTDLIHRNVSTPSVPGSPFCGLVAFVFAVWRMFFPTKMFHFKFTVFPTSVLSYFLFPDVSSISNRPVFPPPFSTFTVVVISCPPLFDLSSLRISRHHLSICY